jgi:hypothetical protein
MMRQPDFVTSKFVLEALARTKKKKSYDLLEKVKFETIEDGLCLQILHEDSYDSDPESFVKMEEFAKEKKLQRIKHPHLEIYLSDAIKVPTEKLKTVLRFCVKQNK